LRAKHLFEYPTIAALAEITTQNPDFNWSQEELEQISKAIESKFETAECLKSQYSHLEAVSTTCDSGWVDY
jgi:hypothetical protein